MTDKGLRGFFETFLAKGSIFLDKKVLQSGYTPETIMHRDKEVHAIAQIMAPALRLEKPSNLFIYGKTGTGKTLSIKHTTSQLYDLAVQKGLPIKLLYLNCKLKKVADTEYRIVAQLAREFGKMIPSTGLPTDEVYKIFFSAVDEKKQLVILVLDEIDQLVKKAGDEILYTLTRINDDLKRAQITIIGISNDLLFSESLDPRIKSSLSEEELLFAPYNAIQIQQILKERAKVAFKPEVIAQGVIEKCAAFSARDHGDARRALELLRVAAELAERKDSEQVVLEHLDEAEDKIERDRVMDVLVTQPKQHQLVLYALLDLVGSNKGRLFTGEIYELYKSLCPKASLRPLTQRRVSDVLNEMDMLGIINARVISKGRYGRTREITSSLSPSVLPKALATLRDDIGL
ncbi:MAG: orc1/cdc6 family replication initiation protein [archaeon]